MVYVRKCFLFLFCLTLSFLAKTQGCSDAGFCTMGAMKPDQQYAKKIKIKLRSIEFSHYYGRSRFGDKAFNYIIDANVGINEKTTVQFKIPYVRVEGPLIDNQGIGDISVSLSRLIGQFGPGQLGITVGSKIPTGEDDTVTPTGRTLPMYNQTGLGTFDLVIGASYITSKWLFATGWQHSFGSSDNSFTWTSWKGTPLEEETNQYPRSRGLNRGEDIMLRVERNFRFLNWNMNVGLLPIYRLNNDHIQLPATDDDGNFFLKETEVKGSKGLALTLLVGGGFQFTTQHGIKVINGFRIIKRDKNPDGLSREFVSNVGYVFKF
jgi:hypothetical protein